MAEPVADSIDDRIRFAALRLFNERGYGAATVDDIARTAGVGVGTIYRRWPDKPALANELYVLVHERVASYQRPHAKGRGKKARFLDLLLPFTEFAKNEPEMMLFLVGQPHHAYLDRKNRRLQAEKDAEVLELVSETGVTSSPEVAAAMVLGTIAQCVRIGADFDGEDLAERLWRALSA